VNRYHSFAHKHSDDLSFVLSYGETDFLVDSGKYNFDEDDPYRKYIRSTLAHNTITVDNVSYPINNSNDFGNPIVKNYYVSNDFSFIQASHSLYDGVEITRTLLFFSDGAIYIHDQIDSMEPHHYTQVFNVGSDVIVQENGNLGANLTSNLDGGKIFLKQLLPVEKSNGYFGSSEPISGWQSTTLNQLNPIQSLHYSKYGNSVQFQTAINIETSIVSANWSKLHGNVVIILEFENGTIREIKLYDNDNDGIADSLDNCPETPLNLSVSGNGCVWEELDDDFDGIVNDKDEFPYDINEAMDSDGDGVGDNADAFPNDANEVMDSDGDGVGDNADAFPNDANEAMDSDGDGVGDNEQLAAEEKKAQQKLFIIIVFLLAIIFYWRRMKRYHY
ncbi:MAG: heparinase II/III domain-containing protein, partial [Candidatus Poseidoniales archaeon]